MTQIVEVDPERPDPALIELAAVALRAGKLVAFPTETVYGLGANAGDPEAVARIFSAKGRPMTDPLIVHLSRPADLATVATDLPPIAERLAAQFWPGPLTLVVRRRPEIPPAVSAGLDTIAVRIPAHPVARALIEAARVPVAAPSANRFSRPSPTTAGHVLDDLDGLVDVIVDGGPTPIGVESTVVDLTADPPMLLRPGGVSFEALRRWMPELAYRPRYLDVATPAAAPGSLLKHYSPDAELRLVTGPAPAIRAYMQAETARLVQLRQTVGLLVADEDVEHLRRLPARIRTLGAQHDLPAIARALFAGIRDLDQAGVDVILARDFDQAGLGLAIRDRLVRAAEGRVVDAAASTPS